MLIEIITKPNCSFCDSAKNFLKMKKIDYFEKKIPEDITREEIMEKFPGVRTVPIITINDKFIGGYQQLIEEFKNVQ